MKLKTPYDDELEAEKKVLKELESEKPLNLGAIYLCKDTIQVLVGKQKIWIIKNIRK